MSKLAIILGKKKIHPQDNERKNDDEEWDDDDYD